MVKHFYTYNNATSCGTRAANVSFHSMLLHFTLTPAAQMQSALGHVASVKLSNRKNHEFYKKCHQQIFMMWETDGMI